MLQTHIEIYVRKFFVGEYASKFPSQKESSFFCAANLALEDIWSDNKCPTICCHIFCNEIGDKDNLKKEVLKGAPKIN
jgi:hypothetical protein